MRTSRLDHLVLTVADIATTVDFYTRVMGMRRVEFGGGRVALAFGMQKINLHQCGREFEPHAGRVQPGSADLCFIVDDSIEDVIGELHNNGVDLIEGPVPRTGAGGAIESVYFRDPDGNLIEVSNYIEIRGNEAGIEKSNEGG